MAKRTNFSKLYVSATFTFSKKMYFVAEETGFEPAQVLRLRNLANSRNGPAMRLLREDSPLVGRLLREDDYTYKEDSGQAGMTDLD